MKTNPYERLKANEEAARLWQDVLDDKRGFSAMVIEAAKYQLEQYPERYEGAEPIQAMALTQAAHRGGNAALAMLDLLGSDAFAESRIKEEQAKAQQNVAPHSAGRGYARHSQMPPELRQS